MIINLVWHNYSQDAQETRCKLHQQLMRRYILTLTRNLYRKSLQSYISMEIEFLMKINEKLTSFDIFKNLYILFSDTELYTITDRKMRTNWNWKKTTQCMWWKNATTAGTSVPVSERVTSEPSLETMLRGCEANWSLPSSNWRKSLD